MKEESFMDQKKTEILWREEKYNVMFYSQNHYNAIRQAMKNKASYEEISALIEQALSLSPTAGSMRNACQHMWGYFKKVATEEEKKQYEQLIQTTDFNELLAFIRRLAEKYEVTYLLESRVLNR
ncbi:YbgA family protein [Solibacillus sp. FSL W7-1324]|uniref:YbgA family protein n=1 Tax=Solibacillus sp. FSL W7-1324 TaxID=2921701 RepID=UPI0030FB8357